VSVPEQRAGTAAGPVRTRQSTRCSGPYTHCTAFATHDQLVWPPVKPVAELCAQPKRPPESNWFPEDED
jgi:hypothetical protein